MRFLYTRSRDCRQSRVEAEVVDTRLDSFTISFTPNDDVQSYWCVAGEKGVMQSQYEMFYPMFGFANFNQMIQQWGIERKAPTDNTWKDMTRIQSLRCLSP